jgi:hypothetical protein
VPWTRTKENIHALEFPKGYIVSGCWELKRKFRVKGGLAMRIKTLPLVGFEILLLIIAGCSQSPEQLKKSLFDAVKSGDVATVRRSIASKVDVNAPETPGGWSALDYAARSGNPEIVKILLNAGADPNYVGTAPGQTGTIISLKPLILAQATMRLAEAAQHNPALRFEPPDLERAVKAPFAVEGYEQVCALLEPVTKN